MTIPSLNREESKANGRKEDEININKLLFFLDMEEEEEEDEEEWNPRLPSSHSDENYARFSNLCV